MKLVISTSALMGRKPIAASRRCSQAGEGPFFTPRTSRNPKAGQSEGVVPKSSPTVTGHGNRPSTGWMLVSRSLPMSAAARSRAMPLTPAQSPRLGVRLISITGSSSPAHCAKFAPTGAASVSSMMPSWSSEICNSNSDTSMPRLSTPRILPMPSVMFLPGMKAPGGTNTPFMPARALGAPHTTCTGSPAPVSTMHTRRRSAFGCCWAEITRAMVNGAKSLPRSATLSTSSPIMVSLSTIAASGASVSRCSLSQARVNFIIPRTRGLFPLQLAGEAWQARPAGRDRLEWPSIHGLNHKDLQRERSVAQSSRKRGEVERAEAVMGEPAHVGLEKRAEIRHAVFEHGDAIDPQAPGEALILIRIKPAIAQHVRMHHAAAENLHPVLAFAEPDLALVAPALDVDLEGRLGKRKERRPEAHLDLIDLEERLAEFLQDPFEMAEVGALVDDEPLDLMEHGGMGLVAVAAVGAAGDDDADRRLLRQHRPDLHRRGMRAQQQLRAVGLRIEKERVLHLPRRMALREIEFGEIVIVGLDVGSFGDGKPHVGEDRGQFIHDLADGVDAADLRRRLTHRQRHVHGLGVEPLLERQLAQRVLARGERGADSVLEAVDQRALLLARFGRHRAERLQERGHRAVAAECRNPHGFERRFVVGSCDGGEEFGLERAKIGH